MLKNTIKTSKLDFGHFQSKLETVKTNMHLPGDLRVKRDKPQLSTISGGRDTFTSMFDNNVTFIIIGNCPEFANNLTSLRTKVRNAFHLWSQSLCIHRDCRN